MQRTPFIEAHAHHTFSHTYWELHTAPTHSDSMAVSFSSPVTSRDLFLVKMHIFFSFKEAISTGNLNENEPYKDDTLDMNRKMVNAKRDSIS